MEHNTHHMWWNRSWYRTPILRTLRQHQLCQNVLSVPIHNQLHAELSPPPKPSPELAIGAILMLDDMRQEGLIEPVDVHLALADHFLEQDNGLAKRIGHHMLHQAGFIKEGIRHDIQ